MVFDGSRVLQFCFLGDADELLDVEPFTFEKSCIVWYWIIRIVGRRNTADDSELLDFLPSVLKVGEWRLRIEKFDALDVLRLTVLRQLALRMQSLHPALGARQRRIGKGGLGGIPNYCYHSLSLYGVDSTPSC